MKREKISYDTLDSRKKESYNFQKVSGLLADYGYTTYRINDDFNGADFHAVHTTGSVIKIQLKGRLHVDKKYLNKDIYIAFRDSSNAWYVYPHDEIYLLITSRSEGAFRNEGRSSKNIPNWIVNDLEQYKLL